MSSESKKASTGAAAMLIPILRAALGPRLCSECRTRMRVSSKVASHSRVLSVDPSSMMINSKSCSFCAITLETARGSTAARLWVGRMIVQRGAFIESQYQQSPAQLSRFCFINGLRCNDEVDPPIEKSLGTFPRGIYDRLLVHVKAGVNEDRDTGYFLERRKNIEIQRIGFTHDGLRPS